MISKTTSILFNTAGNYYYYESLIEKSPSNPSDLREAEYVLQHQQVEKDFNNTGMINELGSVDSRHTHRDYSDTVRGRVTLTLP